jgi:hypothetical protein
MDLKDALIIGSFVISLIGLYKLIKRDSDERDEKIEAKYLPKEKYESDQTNVNLKFEYIDKTTEKQDRKFTALNSTLYGKRGVEVEIELLKQRLDK